jgi:hypothetical protein
MRALLIKGRLRPDVDVIAVALVAVAVFAVAVIAPLPMSPGLATPRIV